MPSPLRLLIPALNEAENLPHLMAELLPMLEQLDRPWSLLFVDDGSTDGSADLIRRLGRGYDVSVISHARNLGPGAAFGTGFARLLPLALEGDPIVTLEADTTSDLTLLPRMLECFDRGADVVLASVYHPEGGLKNTGLHRRLLSVGANALLQTGFQMRGIHTFSSFYRVYRAGSLAQALEVYGRHMMSEPGFASVVELLIRLMRLGARIEEVPMVLDSARRRGASRMKILRTIRAYLRLMVRLGLEPPPAEPAG